LAKYDLTISQSESFRRLIYWTDSNNTPIPTTNYSAKMQIKIRKEKPAVLTLSSETGEIVLADNTITLNLSSEQTTLLDYKEYIYDLFLTHTDGTVVKLLYGIISTIPAITDLVVDTE
jgi:hypothetical protein